MKQYKYKFSVIIPVYNVEEYIGETIESVINQTIGFESNIQIILVNDGSKDNSEAICQKYQSKYPNNIVYIKQKNKGVSAARNNGLKHIKGKYVSFLDSDDKWDKCAFKRIWNYFEQHYDEIDLVDCRVKLFGDENDYYIFDYKYKKSQIIDTNINYKWTVLNAPTAIFKADAIKKMRFDERLKYSEDTKFINEVLLKKCKYGIKHNAKYFYRKRKNPNSAVDKRLNEKSYFIGPLEYCFTELIEQSIKKYSKVVPQIQELVLNNLIWRIKLTDTKNVLNKKEFSLYFKLIEKLIHFVDDDFIINKKWNDSYRIWLLKLKYGDESLNKFSCDNKYIYFDNKKLAEARKITYKNLRVDKNKLIIHGRYNSLCMNDDMQILFKDYNTNKTMEADIHYIKLWNKVAFDNSIVEKGLLFRIEIPIIKEKQEFINEIVINEKKLICRFNSIWKYGLSPKYKSYYTLDKRIILSNINNHLILERYHLLTLIKRFFIRNVDLLIKMKLRTLLKKNIIYPFKGFKNEIKPLKNIILLESNPDFSDNTKFLFDEMINKGVNKKYKLVWCVNDPEKFSNIKIDNVEFVKFFENNTNCKKDDYAKYCYRNAKIIIDANKYIKKAKKKQKRIHLNHGSPFKDAISYNTNIGEIDAIFVQSKFFVETESITKDIDKSKIFPLGFPRSDILYQDNDFKFKKIDNLKHNKIILWLPTYRSHKLSAQEDKSFPYGLPCINNLDELVKLNKKLESCKITIFIKFHPAENIKKLEKIKLSNIKIIKDEELKNISLYQLFGKVDALITDYSSVYFDFCLTKKNIGLAISDIDDYIKKQGNFQYEYKDVIIGNYMYNNDDLLEFIDDIFKGKDRTYEERMKLIKKYDDYRDGKATERVYEFIKKFL